MPISAYYKQVSPSSLEKILADSGSNLFDEVWEETGLEKMALLKVCEALFFLLTGHDKTDGSTFAKAIFGRSLWRPGEGYFDKEDGIYYGNSYLTGADVQEIADVLRQVSEDEILQRFLQNDFEATWGQPENLILPYFRQLNLFYLDGSNSGNAVLLKIT